MSKFSAQYEQLSTTTISSDFMKGLVDLGTDLLEVLTEIIDTFGTLATLVGAGGLLGTFSKHGSNMPCLTH